MRRVAVATSIALGVLWVFGAGSSSARSTARVFYLSVHPRQCLIVPTRSTGNAKTFLVVPCSDAAHNLEVYAIGHGGWGHGTPPSAPRGYAIAKSICLSAFQRIAGRVMPSGEGWWASWPDPGAETARYGDKMICSLRTWPQWRPLGPGWHVH